MSFRDWVFGLQEGANVIVIPILFAIAFAAFVFGIVKYFFLDPSSEESRRQGREFVLYGLIGMVLLFSAWGVVYILLDILGITPT